MITTNDRPKLREREPRINLLLSAVLKCDGSTTAVRIRNLSIGGAVIETKNLPVEGAAVTLRRGNLVATGKVAWVNPQRAGINFDEAIDTNSWMPGAKTCPPAKKTLSKPYEPVAANDTELPARESVAERLADELAFTGRRLALLGEGLADEPIVVARHATLLQEFDAITQVLTNIGDIMLSEKPDQRINELGNEELKRRLQRRTRL